MPIWVNGTAVVLGLILLLRLRKLGWTVQDKAFGVYLASFAVLLTYDFFRGFSPWVMLPLMLLMGGSWIRAMTRKRQPGEVSASDLDGTN